MRRTRSMISGAEHTGGAGEEDGWVMQGSSVPMDLM
jgi:hypothetical protein